MIAIVAAACRLPDADTPEQYWENLANGRCSIRPSPADRWAPNAAASAGAFLSDVRGFDGAYFGIGPEEAEVTDPQQRILLEVAHEALERAGLAGPLRRGHAVGVFAGVGQADYQEAILRIIASGAPIHTAAAVGNLRNLIPARVSHALDLGGPAIAIDTACSSSLVALHLACQSLERGECDAAIAAGVTLNLTPTAFVMLSRAGALSPTGRSRPFARDADGIVLGEGIGALVLERLDDARRRGAPVLALVRGSAINNDGKTFNPMAPRPAGQVAAMRAAWRNARLEPSSVTYLEAHGTGTRVGDSVEARSMAAVFAGPEARERAVPLALGSAKGNVGHLLSAAGFAGILKTALALERRELPPTLSASDADPEHGLDRAGIELVRELRPWLDGGAPRRAGVNSFGFGGTNAHVILEEAPERPTGRARRGRGDEAPPPLFTLSAKTDGALRETARRLAAWLRAHPDADIHDVAYSASVARDPGTHRIALVGGEDVADRLERWACGDECDVLHGVVPDRTPSDVSELRTGPPIEPDAGEIARTFVSRTLFDRSPYDAGRDLEVVALPTYPFEHREHWVDEGAATTGRVRIHHALLRDELEMTIDRAVLGARIAAGEPLVAEHVVHGVHLLPGAGCIELMRAGARHALGVEPAALADVTFARPVRVDGVERQLRVVVERREARIEVSIRDEQGDALATATVLRAAQPGAGVAGPVHGAAFATDTLYRELVSRGMEHGASLRAVRAIAIDERAARADLVLPDSARGRAFGVHPALLDAAMQPIAAVLLARDATDRDALFVPFHVERVELLEAVPDRCTATVAIEGSAAASGDIVKCDVEISAGGEPRLRLRGLRIRRVTAAALRAADRDAETPWYEVAYRDAPIAEGGALRGRWLVAPADHPASHEVVERMRRAGAACDAIDPDELGAMLPLGRVEGVIFVGAVGASFPIDDLEELGLSQTEGAFALLTLARAIDGAARRERPSRLLVVTSGATSGAQPENATTLGLALALSDELPGVQCRGVDLADAEPPLPAAIADLVVREAAHDGGAGEVLRWRDGLRTRRVLEPARPPAASVALSDDGVYLVTGGAEGLGYEVARSLAAPGRTLVLVGRTPLDASPGRLAHIAQLAATGARVEYEACDIADETATTALFAKLAREHRRLDGLVHAAGIAAPGRIGARDDATFARVLAPKVHGTWLIARELERNGLKPSFVALFSSISAARPGLGGGLGDYVAANAYLDAFAASRRERGEPYTAIAWSVWSETGMGRDAALLRAMEARGLLGIPTSRGVDAFHRALAADGAHVVFAPTSAERSGDAGVTTDVSDAAITFADAAFAPEPLMDEIQELVAAALEQPKDAVPVDQSFLAMGLDSLTALELVKTLEDRHRVELPATLFFEHPTIEALAAQVALAKERTGGGEPSEPPTTPTAPERTEAPLSPVQRAFYLHHRLHGDVPAFSFVRLSVRGALSLETLRSAANEVAARHPMLRAYVAHVEGGAPVQRIAEDVSLPIVDHGAIDDVERLSDRVVNAGFDLATPPLARVDVARDASGAVTHVLVTAHHIVADAWSLHVIASDLFRAYAAAARGERLDVRALRARFFDAIAAPRHDLDRDLAWWRDHLASLPSLQLPFDGDASTAPEAPLVTHTTELSREDTQAFARVAAASGVSAFHLSLAVHARCLSRWAGGAEEVVVNVARARREARLAGIEEVVGSFADTLPLRLRVNAGEPLATLAARARDALLTIEQHASPTSIELAKILPAAAGALRVASPASYSYARFPLEAPAEMPEVVSIGGRTATPATRLGLAVFERDGALSFAWTFPERLASRATVARLADEHLREHRAAAGERPAHTTAMRIVAKLREAPDRVAIVDRGRELTRGEVDRASAAIATALRARGASRGAIVGLLADQGSDAVLGIVGILRAGAAWLPLDPEHPPARLRDQLAQAGARLVLCARDASDAARAISDACTPIAIADATAAVPEAHDEPPPAGDDDLAYVIFTSGSTGRPKGVPILERSLRNYLTWAVDTFGYSERDVLLGTSSTSFDASVRQLLAPLLAGATLVACPRELARDPARLLEVVEERGVTVLNTIPSLLARILKHDIAPLGRLTWLKVGGEALPPALVTPIYDRLARAPKIANLYGPTETTINATYHVVMARPSPAVTRIPIGRTAAFAELRVLDENGARCPRGTAGELYVGGPGLSPGYLGAPEQTARAFVHAPDGVRLYRTGDRVIERDDGTLDFLGRVDDQIKLHGHRIEPGEIEAVLARHPRVALAAVRAVGVAPDVRLEAWIEPRGAAPDEDDVRAFLREHLPEPMQPRRVHVVASLPTTTSGKVDRGSLPLPVDAAAPRAPRGGAPETETERHVAATFSAVLREPQIARDDDFFVLGGDSMGVLDVFERLEAAGVGPLPRPGTLYRARTVAALASAIDAHREAVPISAPAPRAAASNVDSEWFPLSATQRGFVLARGRDDASSGWIARIVLEGQLEPAAFREAVRHVAARHPMLRTTIDLDRRPPAQRIAEGAELDLEIRELSSDAEVERVFREARTTRFAPSRGAPVRLVLCRLKESEHVLVVAADHLVGDALSGWTFAREILVAYDAIARGQTPDLLPIRSTFRDYVTYATARAAADEDVAYFRDVFAKPYAPPRAFAATEVGPAGGSRHEIALTTERTEALRAAAAREGGTLFERVLGAFAHALAERAATDDLVIGTALAGRDAPLPDIHRVFGPFATSVPVRIRCDRASEDGTSAAAARAAAAARRHALTPGEIARALPSGTPVQIASGMQLFFTFMDFEALGALASESLRVRWVDSLTEGSVPDSVDVQLAARRVDGALRLSFYAAPHALGARDLAVLAERVVAILERTAPKRERGSTRVRFASVDTSGIDAALIGYLPAPREAASAAGLADAPGIRETLRASVFPNAEPRWLERLETPLGTSALLCLPLFADELAGRTDDLAMHVARAVSIAKRAGVRSISLAGMLPSLTAFGRDVLKSLATSNGGPPPDLTTGHATTVTSVVKSLVAATRAMRVELARADVAFVGVGSIGAATAELLLAVAPHPRRIVLADLPRNARRIEEIAGLLRGRGGFTGPISVAASSTAPDGVYAANVIVGATSTPRVLDVDRLAPGTILVDDSFPPIVDPVRALARMKQRRDVLIVGGGLVDCGAVTRTVDGSAAPEPIRAALEAAIARAGVASCQLEPLLRRRDPSLPPVLAPVDARSARLYWDAATKAGLEAAPLHLGPAILGRDLLEAIAASVRASARR